MTKRQAQLPPSWKKKKTEPRKTQILPGNGGAFGCMVKNEPNLVDQYVLFTNAIYGRTIPKDTEGQLFHYNVTGYDRPSNLFNVNYRNKMTEEEKVA